VRAIFRNNAENVKALDYVQQRSQQESSSTATIQTEMAQVGVAVNAVRIGQIGDEASLGNLLKTQTDREIALQEQITFQEQERAAEQQKALSRTQQEASEEANLATATYAVKIAEQSKEQRIIEATAEAEAIRIGAEAQAELFKRLAAEIGPQNAALLELLKVIGERNIEITPRVMVIGKDGSGGNEGTALIGTMLDSMVHREPVKN
jgi:flagellar basal body rod protein FlgG